MTKYSKGYDCLAVFVKEIRLYIIPQGTQLCVLKGHDQKVSFFEFIYRINTDFIEYLISAGYDNIIRLNSFPACRIIKEFLYHSNPILNGYFFISRFNNNNRIISIDSSSLILSKYQGIETKLLNIYYLTDIADLNKNRILLDNLCEVLFYYDVNTRFIKIF